jgi:hypothetical protein
MQDGTSLFKITDLQGQTFKAIPSSSDVYPINGVINPLVLATRAKKPIKNPNKTIIIKIRLIYKPIKI